MKTSPAPKPARRKRGKPPVVNSYSSSFITSSSPSSPYNKQVGDFSDGSSSSFSPSDAPQSDAYPSPAALSVSGSPSLKTSIKEEEDDDNVSIKLKKRIRKKGDAPAAHVCDTCNRNFSTGGHLSRHKRSHSGEKRYACLVVGCPAKFTRRDNRTAHIRSHAAASGRHKPRITQEQMNSILAGSAAQKGNYREEKEDLERMFRTFDNSGPMQASMMNFPPPSLPPPESACNQISEFSHVQSFNYPCDDGVRRERALGSPEPLFAYGELDDHPYSTAWSTPSQWPDSASLRAYRTRNNSVSSTNSYSSVGSAIPQRQTNSPACPSPVPSLQNSFIEQSGTPQKYHLLTQALSEYRLSASPTPSEHSVHSPTRYSTPAIDAGLTIPMPPNPFNPYPNYTIDNTFPGFVNPSPLSTASLDDVLSAQSPMLTQTDDFYSGYSPGDSIDSIYKLPGISNSSTSLNHTISPQPPQEEFLSPSTSLSAEFESTAQPEWEYLNDRAAYPELPHHL